MATELPDDLEELERWGQYAFQIGDEDAMRAIDAKMRDLEASPVEYAKDLASNIPSSAANLAQNMFEGGKQLVTDPAGTVDAVGDLLQSGFATGQRKVRELAAGVDIEPGENEQMFQEVLSAMDQRYGGWEEFKRTAKTDPIGVLADVASITPLGAGTRLSNVRMLEPVTGAVTAAGKVGNLIPERVPISLYQQGTRLQGKQAEAAARAGVREKIRPNKRGLEKLNKLISDFGETIDAQVAKYSKNQQIPVQRLFEGIKKERAKLLKDPEVGSTAALQMLDKAEDMLRMDAKGRNTFSLPEIQNWKKSAYREGFKFNPDLPAGNMQQQAQRLTGKDARLILEDNVPDIGPMNMRERDMLKLRQAMERKVNAPRDFVKDLADIARPAAYFGPKGVAGAIASKVSPINRTNIAFVLERVRNNDTKWLRENAHLPEVSIVLNQLGKMEEE